MRVLCTPPCCDSKTAASLRSIGTASSAAVCRNFRDSESKFRQMGALKPKMVLRLFEQLGFQTLVLADTDTVWLRDPESKDNLLCAMPETCSTRQHTHLAAAVSDIAFPCRAGFIDAHELADMFISTGQLHSPLMPATTHAKLAA